MNYKPKPIINQQSPTFTKEDEIEITSDTFQLIFLCFAATDPESMATICFLNSVYYRYYKNFQFGFDIPLCSYMLYVKFIEFTGEFQAGSGPRPNNLVDVGSHWHCLKLNGLVELIPIVKAIRAYKNQYIHLNWHLGVFLIIAEQYWMFQQLKQAELFTVMSENDWNNATVMNGSEIAYYLSPYQVNITSPYRMATAKDLHQCRRNYVSLPPNWQTALESWAEYVKIIICCHVGNEEKLKYAFCQQILSKANLNYVLNNEESKLRVTKILTQCWHNANRWGELHDSIMVQLGTIFDILEIERPQILKPEECVRFYIPPDNNDWPLLKS